MPNRIQRRRTKGWRMPPNTVSVARPSLLGNPFPLTPGQARSSAVAHYRRWLSGEIDDQHTELVKRRFAVLARLPSLRGKDLACFCQDGLPCHGDILIELANAPESEASENVA